MSDPTNGLTLALAKIERRRPLSADARAAFLALPFRRRISKKYVDLVREGDRPTECIFLEQGILNRSKTVPDGGRQIVSLHIPGDMVDLHGILVQIADHRVGTETAATTLHVAIPHLLAIAEAYPEIGRALWFDTLVDAAIYREWTVNIGRRDGRERLVHLLLEMGYRIEQIGLAPRTNYVLPISQADLADAVGLTQVHTSRVLTALRNDGILDWDGGKVSIPDWAAACGFCGFDPVYLHGEGPRHGPAELSPAPMASPVPA